MITNAGPGGRSAEREHVLYAAATRMDLRELLWIWEPWRPTWELPDMLVNVPVLAPTIIELVNAGLVEIYAGPFGGGGESDRVPVDDVPSIVTDADNWWCEPGTPLQVELHLTDAAGPVDIPTSRTRPLACSGESTAKQM
jgi:hypothetical protein